MGQEQAVAFLERVENDEHFAKELESLREDPPAVVDKVRAAGFDASPEEIREAFLDRYGAELTEEQMDQIAAGSDPAVVGGGTGAGPVGWLGGGAGGRGGWRGPPPPGSGGGRRRQPWWSDGRRQPSWSDGRRQPSWSDGRRQPSWFDR